MHVAIIGNGIAGVTTAIRLREKCPDWNITMISGETDHHYSRPALMYIFMGHMRYEDTKPYEDRFWEKHRIDLMRAWVTQIDTEKKLLHFGGQTQPVGYDKLVIASGSESNKFGWPGQDLGGVQGLYNIQDLELLYKNIQDIKQAVIVGGGLIGIELGEMLHARNVPVTFLIREVNFWENVLPKEEAMMVNRIIQEDHLGLVRETELKEIHDDGNGRVGAITTGAGERMECQFVGLTAGVHPNIGFLKDSGIPTGRGILVDWSLRTEVPDVFAVGDCAEIKTGAERNLLQQVWYTGRMQAQVAADVLAGEERGYDPGIWYNSAKFLDLEYQVYGQVNMRVPGEKNLFWEHESHRKSIRIVYTDKSVIGFNLFGVRFRHEVCERWILEKQTIHYVLDHLKEANFDPEFFKRHEEEVAAEFRKQVTT